ncbi:MAG: hypothetical protein IKW27_06740 [Bacteroidales bacterium]|nr:hypothetical protein [Bacteroidales bacterium]
MTRYLLRTDLAIIEFRKRHAKLLRDYSAAYIRWINSLPLMEWTRLTIPKGHEESIIGLICCLYVEGAVNITFSNTCTSIRRDPANEEEYQQWLDEHCK